jgi:hypothetical protein
LARRSRLGKAEVEVREETLSDLVCALASDAPRLHLTSIFRLATG